MLEEPSDCGAGPTQLRKEGKKGEWEESLIAVQFFFLKICFKCLFLRERGREQAGEGQRERGRQNPKQAPLCQHRA